MTVAIILAGGYAKRMWPLTRNTPKALLKVNEEIILTHIIRKLEKLDINRIIISTNEKFRKHFEDFLKKFSSTKALILSTEPSTSEKNKLGAVKGLQYTIKKNNIDEPLLLILGDNYFEDNLHRLITPRKISVATTTVSLQDATSFGIMTVNRNNTVETLVEKPDKPKSNIASTGIYYFPKFAITEILKCKTHNDNIGNLIQHLLSYNIIHTIPLKGKWKDIGS